MGIYNCACKLLKSQILDIFGYVTTDTIKIFFEFDSIYQVINCFIFFVEDEEGQLPEESDVSLLKCRLQSYLTSRRVLSRVFSSNVVLSFLKSKNEFILNRIIKNLYKDSDYNPIWVIIKIFNRKHKDLY